MPFARTQRIDDAGIESCERAVIRGYQVHQVQVSHLTTAAKAVGSCRPLRQ